MDGPYRKNYLFWAAKILYFGSLERAVDVLFLKIPAYGQI